MGNTQHKDENQKRDDSAGPQEAQEIVADSESSRQQSKRNLNLLYAFITVIIVCLCIAVIAVSVVAALSTKLYSATNSGRAVGLVILDISAAIAMTVALFSSAAFWRRHNKQILLSAIALGVLLVAQAVIIAVCVQVRQHDKEIFSKALVDSFQLAQQDNLRAVRLWHATQKELRCCGVLSPEDYKDHKLPPFFPTEIPISCCPSYDSSRTTFMQEREREMCKLKKNFYKDGCRDMVLQSVVHTENTLNILVAILIVCELIETVWNITYVILRRKKETEKELVENHENDDKHGGKEFVIQTKKHTEVGLKTKA